MNQQGNMPIPGINMFMGGMNMQNQSPVNLPDDLKKLLEENINGQDECSQCYSSFTEPQKAAMRAVEEQIQKAKEQQQSAINFNDYANQNYPSTEMEVEEFNIPPNDQKPQKTQQFEHKFNQEKPSNDNGNGFWKFNEDKTLKAAEEYIKSTYHQHYTSEESKVQVLDIIQAIGDGVPFCRDNLIKYSARFGKKNGFSKLDALKIIHYGILLYNFAGFHKNSTDRYETF